MPSLQQHAYVMGPVVVLLTLLACGGDNGTAPPTPAAITLVSSPTVSGRAGESLIAPLVIKVTSASGIGVPGVVVSFTSGANSGAVAESSVTTKDDGTASTTWTLGTTVGTNIDTVQASVRQLAGAPVVITATVTAAAAATLTIVSGDGQPGTPGQPLTEPLVVVARDQFSNPASGVAITWSVEGGGSLSATSSTTDTDGTASVTWTLGAGTNLVHATATGLSGSPATFQASFTSSGAVVLSTVSPDALVEGQSATLTGKGFGTTPADNAVFVDGAPAVITAATATSLAITVPTFDCRPARDIDVRVVVSGDNSNVVSHPLTPAASPLSLAAGQQLILQNPADFCLQFSASVTDDSYLIGVQSVSELVTSITPVTMSADAAQGLLASIARPPLRPSLLQVGGGREVSLNTARATRWRRHRAAEAQLLDQERRAVAPHMRQNLVRRPARRATLAASAIPASVQPGDTFTVHVPVFGTAVSACDTSATIAAVVRVVGSKGIWVEDAANPAGGFTTADIQALSDQFDNVIYDVDTQYFGLPSDNDANGHVVIVITKEVNQRANILGFVSSTDFIQSRACASSNEGEFYYGRAPDPGGLYERPAPYSLADAQMDAQILIAHEFTHDIQFAHRFAIPEVSSFQPSWMMEGQATLAEEVVGNQVTGRSTGQNYGIDVAFNSPQTSDIDWYVDRFQDLGVYFGFKSQFSKVLNAPERCSWLGSTDDGNRGPCLSGREVYGVPWSILRWLSDQFGPSFQGGEQALQRALVDDANSGFATIEHVVGVPMDSLLPQWAAMLYVDDTVPGVAPRLTLPSWNLANIFSHLVGPAQLQPRARGFTTFSDAIQVRGGSTGYFVMSGVGHDATALKARDGAGNPLPGNMRLWVVRLK